jgi:hypothetical protein
MVYRFALGFLLIAASLALLLPGSTPSLVWAGAGEPPSGTERVTGFPIDGVLTSTYADDGSGAGTGTATTVIVGSCKKVAVAFGPAGLLTDAATFASQTADSVINRRLSGVGPAGCYSPGGGESLIITNVTKFNNTGTAIGADVSLQVVEPK